MFKWNIRNLTSSDLDKLDFVINVISLENGTKVYLIENKITK